MRFAGYFEIGGQLYCDVHAQQAAQPPGPDMVAVPTYRLVISLKRSFNSLVFPLLQFIIRLVQFHLRNQNMNFIICRNIIFSMRSFGVFMHMSVFVRACVHACVRACMLHTLKRILQSWQQVINIQILMLKISFLREQWKSLYSRHAGW